MENVKVCVDNFDKAIDHLEMVLDAFKFCKDTIQNNPNEKVINEIKANLRLIGLDIETLESIRKNCHNSL